MKINPNIKIRNVAGENIVMRVGRNGTDMTTVIAFNESSMTLCNKLADKDFTIDDAVQVLTEAYEVDEATARRDAEEWLRQMRDNGMLCDE